MGTSTSGLDRPLIQHKFTSFVLFLEQARQITRRSQLYGCGSGSKLPHVNRGKGGDPSKSASKSKLRESLGDNGTVISYSSVPSDDRDSYEHDMVYRMAHFSTTSRVRACVMVFVCHLQLYDPRTFQTQSADRIFAGSAEKRHRAGIGAASREPWYVGYVNSSTARSGSELASACRYGYRGAYNQKLWHTSRQSAPDRTFDQATPAYLRQATLVSSCVAQAHQPSCTRAF